MSIIQRIANTIPPALQGVGKAAGKVTEAVAQVKDSYQALHPHEKDFVRNTVGWGLVDGAVLGVVAGFTSGGNPVVTALAGVIGLCVGIETGVHTHHGRYHRGEHKKKY